MDNKQKDNSDFQAFLELFPEIELPVTLSSEYLEVFSKYNKPIPEVLLKKYILNEEIYIPKDIPAEYNPGHDKGDKHEHEKHKHLTLEELDLKIFDKNSNGNQEQTGSDDESGDAQPVEDEYIAAFRIKDTVKFYAVVYIKISLLNYEYILHTYDLKGNTLSTQSIAKLTIEGDKIKELVAMIDEDLIILVMEGDRYKNEEFNADRSNFLSYEIDDDGYIKEYKL